MSIRSRLTDFGETPSMTSLGATMYVFDKSVSSGMTLVESRWRRTPIVERPKTRQAGFTCESSAVASEETSPCVRMPVENAHP